VGDYRSVGIDIPNHNNVYIDLLEDKIMSKYLLCSLLLLGLLASTTLALDPSVYHLKLLAVQESENGTFSGSDADLYLELKPGSGRVFLDTYPLTKIDTQISTRFAKEIACKHYNLNCDKYDFIYTIKAQSSIIGGPSAGAAIAALTTIAVLDLPHREDIALTGTINSGATIGPVGGLKEKIQAAKSAGMNKVLIPSGTAIQIIPESNSSFNLISYSRQNLSLEVLEVGDLDQALVQITGRELNQKELRINVDQDYQQTMRLLQELLCKRTTKIEEEIVQKYIVLNQNITSDIATKNSLAENATKEGNYYSAASYCFSNNIFLRYQYYLSTKPKIDVLNTQLFQLGQKAEELNTRLNQEKINTISDLQASMIVKERLNDVQQQVSSFNENKGNYTFEEMYSLLAYTEERYYSALSWTQFFNMNGTKYVLDSEQLQTSCSGKIEEAEERYQYVSLYLGTEFIVHIREQIDLAQVSQAKDEPELCLMQATQAKAEADAILSSVGVGEENLPAFLKGKSKAVERVIAENSAEGTFPLLGYSYYQYGNSLRESQPFNALIYYEYALEMSDLSIYFNQADASKKEFKIGFNQTWEAFAIGVMVGMLVMSVFMILHKPKPLFPVSKSRIISKK